MIIIFTYCPTFKNYYGYCWAPLNRIINGIRLAHKKYSPFNYQIILLIQFIIIVLKNIKI